MAGERLSPPVSINVRPIEAAPVQTVTPILQFDNPTVSHPVSFEYQVESLTPKNLVLKDIPLTRDKIGTIPVVFDHEVGHALAGTLQGGISVSYLNFNPSSDGSLARVLFTGSVDSITAAASEAFSGSSYGTAGDKYSVVSMGGDWGSSVRDASARINNGFSEGVQRKVVELTYILSEKHGGHIPGSMWNAIITRAHQEVEFEEQLSSLVVDQQSKDESRIMWEMEVKNSLQEVPENYISETIFENGDTVKEYVVNGNIIYTEKRCGICGGINGGHIQQLHDRFEPTTISNPVLFPTNGEAPQERTEGNIFQFPGPLDNEVI